MVEYKLKALLDEAVIKYETPHFIEKDPISIPHRFKTKEDIEISAFLTSLISWGRREAILKSASHLMNLLDNCPYQFLKNSTEKDVNVLKTFYYRTLDGADMFAIFNALKEAYKTKGSIEAWFKKEDDRMSLIERMAHFYGFMRSSVPNKTKKHLSSMDAGSAGKRANMFLRWMVRSPKCGVDFGIWKEVLPAELFLPLDVHAGNVARSFDLTKRRVNDRKTVEEITRNLREMCREDPIKYDFALFGLDIK